MKRNTAALSRSRSHAEATDSDPSIPSSSLCTYSSSSRRRTLLPPFGLLQRNELRPSHSGRSWPQSGALLTQKISFSARRILTLGPERGSFFFLSSSRSTAVRVVVVVVVVVSLSHPSVQSRYQSYLDLQQRTKQKASRHTSSSLSALSIIRLTTRQSIKRRRRRRRRRRTRRTFLMYTHALLQLPSSSLTRRRRL